MFVASEGDPRLEEATSLRALGMFAIRVISVLMCRPNP